MSVEYRNGDAALSVEAFIALAKRIWQREYDAAKTANALKSTINIGAWSGDRLVGSVRVLSDGYFFSTVPEVMVDPEFRNHGIGRELLHRALPVRGGVRSSVRNLGTSGSSSSRASGAALPDTSAGAVDRRRMDLTVRDVEPADAEGLVRVLNPIIESRLYTALDTPFNVETERDYVIDFSERGIWKVAVREPDRTLVGFQVLEPYATYTHAFDHVGTLGTYVDLGLRRRRRPPAVAATFAAARWKGYERSSHSSRRQPRCLGGVSKAGLCRRGQRQATGQDRRPIHR
jgi:L-amino acid N-acyltransferase YncA